MSAPIHITHVVHALKAGGLENGLINLINHLPRDRFRHTVVCMTDYDEFAERIQRDDVELHCLHKQPGKDPAWYWRAWKLFRRLSPDILHTRNLATMEAQWVGLLAGIRGRVHGEHGWDMYDLGGSNTKYQLLRKLIRPSVHRFVALSGEIEEYLVDKIGVQPQKLRRICNGVDISRFTATTADTRHETPVVIGSVGRMQSVKDPLNLAQAYIALRQMTDLPVKLHMVGDGPLLEEVRATLSAAGYADDCWVPGHREDIPECLAAMDIFVLPSKAEGISNTILEAMAAGLPVVATDVGGNSELLADDCGRLVPASDSEALAQSLLDYVRDSAVRSGAGAAARKRCEEKFSLQAMVEQYQQLYLSLCR